MARTGWLGTELAVRVGQPRPTLAVATYSNGPLVGGLKLITNINNAPAQMLELATEKSKEVTPVKRGERVLVHNGPESGIYLERSDGATGNISAILTRSETDNTLYDAAIELIVAKITKANDPLYIEWWRGMGTTPANKYRYHLQAGTFLLNGSNSSQADELYQMTTAQLNITGDLIDGYYEIQL